MWSENYRWNYDYARLAYDAGFSFENHKLQSNLDFAKIALIDIETVIREKDVNTVERFIPFVTQFALEGEQVKILDPCFVKVFRISQLAVEYLVFCKKYLDNTIILLKKELSTNSEENKELKTTIKDLKSEVNHLRRKLKEIECAPVPEIATFRCEQCGKTFASEDYLQAHIRRRHEPSNNSAYQEETNKLQLEIKELKERLNTTEKLVTHHEQSNEKDDTTKENNWSKLEELQQKFDVLKRHVENELKLLHTQKEFQEKYEKLFEITISKTRAAFLEAENLKEKLEDKSPPERKNSTTQTYMQMQEVAVETSFKDFEQQAKVHKKPDLEYNLDKMQQEIVAETQQQINKVEGALGEMVATSLEKIENQVQDALKKLSVESIKTKEVEDVPQKSPNTINVMSVKQTLQKPLECTNERKPIIQDPKYFLFDTNSLEEKKGTIKKIKNRKNNKSVSSSRNYNTSLRDNESVADRKSKETIQLFTQKETMRPETETESESEEINVVQTKPSTTSTLGQYSSSRIEEAASSEEVFNNLREEVEQLVGRRLKEIGVSPEWKGLPQRSFAQALVVVNHQAELSKKKYPDFGKIRKKITKRLLNTLKSKKKSIVKSHKGVSNFAFATNSKSKYHSDTDSEDERKIALPSSPKISKTAYDSVINEFKNRRKEKRMQMTESSSSDALLEEQDKGDVAAIKSALRSDVQVVEKKKVAFVDGIGDQNLKIAESTTSIASSVFDVPRVDQEEKKTVDSDVSDWDISQILE